MIQWSKPSLILSERILGYRNDNISNSGLESLPQKIKKLFTENIEIKQISLYQSPVKQTKGSPLQNVFIHSELLLEYQYSYIKIGWCHSGLQICSDVQSEKLVALRQGNCLKKKYKGPFRNKNIFNFLKENNAKGYGVLTWNCNHFAEQFLKLFNQKFV